MRQKEVWTRSKCGTYCNWPISIRCFRVIMRITYPQVNPTLGNSTTRPKTTRPYMYHSLYYEISRGRNQRKGHGPCFMRTEQRKQKFTVYSLYFFQTIAVHTIFMALPLRYFFKTHTWPQKLKITNQVHFWIWHQSMFHH